MQNNPYSVEGSPYSNAPVTQQPTSVMQPLIENNGWIRFFGWVLIISGALNCLTIIGILFGWLPIWMGILIKRAGENLQAAQSYNDPNLLYQSSKDLSLYFTISAIVFMISLVLMALYILGLILLFFVGAFAAASGNM